MSAGLTPIYYVIISLIALVITALLGAVKVTTDSPGFALAEIAITMDERCQQLRVKKSNDYNTCQAGLDQWLVDKNLLVVEKCVPNSEDTSTASCPVYVWYQSKFVITKAQAAVEFVNKKAKKA